MTFDISTEMNDGIERITYTPDAIQFTTPLLFQHGAFQGAWCWQWWQEAFAKLGWRSHAYSLPGHGNSPSKRPFPLYTQGYYLQFLKTEIERCDSTPVVIGHSMGGGLAQRYLKKYGDLPAAILVASMPSHGMFLDILRLSFADPIGTLMSSFTLTLKAQVRTPERAAYLFLDEGSQLSPEQFRQRLTNESLAAIAQHNALMWSPPQNINTPMLWLGGELDVTFDKVREAQSAEYYKARYHIVEGSGHNIMMAKDYAETASLMHEWLVEQGIS